MCASSHGRKRFFLPLLIILFFMPFFVFPLAITSATLLISADDCFAAYIDGCLIYDTGKITSNSPWDETFTEDVTGCLTKCGPHVLAINYYDKADFQRKYIFRNQSTGFSTRLEHAGLR